MDPAASPTPPLPTHAQYLATREQRLWAVSGSIAAVALSAVALLYSDKIKRTFRPATVSGDIGAPTTSRPSQKELVNTNFTLSDMEDR